MQNKTSSPGPKYSEQRLWAKSAVGHATQGETLLQHTHNVVRVLAGLRELHPTLAATVRNERFWHMVFWSCVLHDFGKAAGGFQRQLRPDSASWGKRHEVLSLAFLPWLLRPNHEEYSWISAAIASHHKDVGEIAQRYPLDEEPEDDVLVQMVADLSNSALHELWEILTVQAPVWRKQLGFDVAGVEELAFAQSEADRTAPVAGTRESVVTALRAFRQLAYSLERTDARLPSALLAVALRGIVISADHQASAHVFGLRPTTLRGPDDLLARLRRERATLHQHQRDAAVSHGSRMLMAPTGSGKTEAALLWASAQAVGGAVPRLFYVLPFQASMNAMHIRLDHTFPGDVGLQHGRSLHALYRQLLDTESSPKTAEVLARREQNLARLHHHPVRVLSPYQLLKACYRLRGYEAILLDVYDGLFILDEIHAYEPVRLALILKMFEHFRRHYGARFFVMSATLPGVVRDALSEALDLGTPIMASPDLYTAFGRHILELVEGDLFHDGLAHIVEAAQQGQSVLVCCNTVKRAQQTWKRLSMALGDKAAVELLHSGFNARDRLSKEEAIRRDIGAGTTRTRQVILVATQVVEVSLNIDFDTLFSDPAPLEALLQRFGRVNRLGTRGLAPVHVFTRPDDGQKVYDASLVQSTLGILREVAGHAIDEAQTTTWLDRIYVDDIAKRWREDYNRQAEQFEKACLATLHAFQSDEKMEEMFYAAFDAVEVLPVSLEQQFLTLREADPLAADSLLVSVRSSRYNQLKRQGKVLTRTEPWPRVVDVPYSDETGLMVGQEEE